MEHLQKRAKVEDLHISGYKSGTVVAKLVTTELEAALSSSLLDLYMLLPQPRIALLEGSNFRKNFERAGRRIDEMDLSSQVLFSVILAVASRVSDHPLLIGSSAPNLSNLATHTTSDEIGPELVEWGKRREEACLALAEKAVKMADEHGVWREPSPTNIATLLILEGLLEYQADDSMFRNSKRPYTDAYISHLREVLTSSDEDARFHILDLVLNIGDWWQMRENTLSAFSGRPPTFSDDEFCLITTQPILSLEAALDSPEFDTSNLASPYCMPFYRIFYSWMMRLAQVSRDCPAGLTGFRARRKPLDFAFARSMMSKLDLAMHTIPILERRARQYLGPWDTCGDAERAIWSFFRILQVSTAYLYRLLHFVVTTRLGELNGIPPPSLPRRVMETAGLPLSDQYWADLRAFHVETRAKAFEGTRLFVKMLHFNVSFGIMSGASLFFARLPAWLQLLLEQPTVEEGGLVQDWTYEAKIRDMKKVLRALRAVGWAFPKLAAPAADLRREIDVLEARKRVYEAIHHQPDPVLSFDALPSPTTSASSSPSTSLSQDELEQMLKELAAGTLGSTFASEEVSISNSPLSWSASPPDEVDTTSLAGNATVPSSPHATSGKGGTQNHVVQMLSSMLG
ncbi:Zn(2)-C7 fungal-type transcription factor [Pseudohyphozyma bogoriensis]|nr:Zn(2)-C7 fungal-type transcription factor [Pseudohyphozyma bogoriensis]